ncbi:MAG: hypothetical protein RJB66_713 [Pseudomonadota bacterium]|jgi:methylglutaconyl-CoA hydratase
MHWLEINDSQQIYTITLKRPEVRNAFNPELIKELTAAFKAIPEAIRLVILRGEGKVFCSGADLEWMKSMVNFTLEENKADSELLYEMFKAMQDCPKPILAVAQGAAMGGALGLLACSDIVIAETATQFCFSEVRLGLAPAVISSFILQKSTLGQSAPWMISGKMFGVKEAKAMGLVHEAGSTEEVEEFVKSWIQTFLDAAPVAVAETKKLLKDLSRQDGKTQKSVTTSLIAARRVSDEGQEGLKSFLEKRQPQWKVSLK